jgi:cohesin loading factor subunit SCC2
VKAANQTENNAVKTIALEHLGVIAARIRSSTSKTQQSAGEAGPNLKSLKPLDEVFIHQIIMFSLLAQMLVFGQIVSDIDTEELDKLLSAHIDVASHLCKRSSEDQAYDVCFFIQSL